MAGELKVGRIQQLSLVAVALVLLGDASTMPTVSIRTKKRLGKKSAAKAIEIFMKEQEHALHETSLTALNMVVENLKV